ncbi:hypothetical protein SAMN05216548_102311 [Faunimonas pinastri]|uniref:Lipoprotein n=1 Tax=Faunimonas pinastri TaxID=1855383 RepID=A0A1H9D2E0_9HYPH|nr:hypothetical protein [Faunimonas pinastri]SEQ06993.1 hypothetical protein SAMN05216548_102311 [Faunimonas pinastri]
MISSTHKRGLGAAAVLAAMLAGCVSPHGAGGQGAKDYLEYTAASDPTDNVVENIRACWFQGNRPAFAGLSYTPESYANHPRVLIVPRSDPTGLPKLVVDINGTQVRAYGPLLGTSEGPTITQNLQKWIAGGSGC